jgi:DnaK suppressor protein
MSLSPTEQARLQQTLEQQLADLTQTLEGHRTRHSDGGVHIRTHRDETDDDAAVEAMNRQDIDAVQRSMDAIADVRAALARLASGSYGLCAACGEAIAPARLQAAPAARLCIQCAQIEN